MPVAYKQKLEGKSNSHLITFNDGNDYVVKFYQTGFEKSLANEWVGYCLGRYLQLPIPFGKIIDVTQEFSGQFPDLAEMSQIPYQFASLYIPNCQDGHDVETIHEITNHCSLAGVILLDYWLFNRDRTRKNILLHETGPNQFHLWMIDQAEIFGGYAWSQTEIENLPDDLIKSATHQLMASFIKKEEQFFQELEYIQTIPILLLEEIMALIPDEWNVTKEEKKAMVTTLVTRRHKVLPEVIRKFIKYVYRPLHEKRSRD
ncbi:HipA family kinase [Bacillus rubiinfantis]|uniref:HipA family kinase n=1 Tax=Bacillus rubiinfantis TaxID=1499680 RepID=UPI0005A81A25|nr:HipA family kinase [Bacillus rubiinfantis]